MKLYNSYGQEMESNGLFVATKKNITTETDIVDTISDVIRDNGNLKDWKFDLLNNRLYLFHEAVYEFEDETKVPKIGGIAVYINPADKDVCKASHFVCDKDKCDFEKDNLGFVSASNGDNGKFLRQSLMDDKYFPELQGVMEALIVKYDLYEKDAYAYMKNMYLLTKGEPHKEKDGFMWNLTSELKKVAEDIKKSDCSVDFTNATGRHTAYINNGYICCEGEVCKGIDSFINAVKRGTEFALSAGLYGKNISLLDNSSNDTKDEHTEPENGEER